MKYGVIDKLSKLYKTHWCAVEIFFSFLDIVSLLSYAIIIGNNDILIFKKTTVDCFCKIRWNFEPSRYLRSIAIYTAHDTFFGKIGN